MKKIVYNKLIRDKIPQIIEKSGSKPEVSRLDNKNFDLALRKKLLEEAIEVRKAKTKEDLLNELSDIMEVVNAIAKDHSILITDIEKSRKRKFNERGGFEKRLFLEYTYKV